METKLKIVEVFFLKRFFPCGTYVLTTRTCCTHPYSFVSHIITLLPRPPFQTHQLQMYEKIRSSKVSYGLVEKVDKAKKLVQVGGLSEASAEG